MSHNDDALPYDPSDLRSLLKYARKLEGQTLGAVCPEDSFRSASKDKGKFGNILQVGYFKIPANSLSEPDFRELGVELKTTPMKRVTRSGLVPKERLSLGMINYDELPTQRFDESFLKKNRHLLIVFYLDDHEEDIRDKKILSVVLWEFPEADLKIINGDWDIISDKVRESRAHELSCGDTFFLEAAPKGPGKGKGERKQRGSNITAKPRAFALKQRYIKTIWDELNKRDNNGESLIKDLSRWDETKTFEELIIERFEPYIGMNCDDIIDRLGLQISSKDKAKYAAVARGILGIKGRKIKEFEKAGIEMKTLRLKPNGTPKESMSFPHFRYGEIDLEEWDESSLREKLDKKFLLVVYQIDDDEAVHLKAAKFWNMPASDLDIARVDWERAICRMRAGNFKEILASTESAIVHVRPHGKRKNDLYVDTDGTLREKKSFWLNSQYLKNISNDLHSDKNGFH